MRKYTTVQGDMWDGIAKVIYGDERYMNTLLEANQDKLDVVVFPAGVVLNVPDMAIPKAVTVPPWKR